jgi:hypothetical protein
VPDFYFLKTQQALNVTTMTGKDKDKDDTVIPDKSKSSRSNIMNTSNPYYIHPSDPPAMCLFHQN